MARRYVFCHFYFKTPLTTETARKRMQETARERRAGPWRPYSYIKTSA